MLRKHSFCEMLVTRILLLVTTDRCHTPSLHSPVSIPLCSPSLAFTFKETFKGGKPTLKVNPSNSNGPELHTSSGNKALTIEIPPLGRGWGHLWPSSSQTQRGMLSSVQYVRTSHWQGVIQETKGSRDSRKLAGECCFLWKSTVYCIWS